MAYSLSAELCAHTNDVRCICSYKDDLGEDVIVTGGRDKCINLWRRTTDGIPAVSYELFRTIRKHKSYVNCICVVPPDASCGREEILLASGSDDKTVMVHSLSKEEPVKVFENVLQGAVAGIIYFCGHLITVSWDGILCIWEESPIKADAHSPSAYTVAALEGISSTKEGYTGSFVITGGADKLIKLWNWCENSVKCIKVFTGHEGPVRNIKTCDLNHFMSVANDQVVKLWDLNEGVCLQTIPAHDSYVYGLSLYTDTTGSAFVTSGEDSLVKVWEVGVCIQSIELPAISVWCVHCLDNGDIVVGSSDNVVRIFTRDPSRKASEEDCARLLEEVASFKKQGQDLDHSQFPGPEALKEPGKKHGDVKVIRNNKKSEVYQWNGTSQDWELIGYASGKAPDKKEESEKLPNGKWLYEGKEYDIIIPIEIEEDFGVVRNLKLPYNKDTDPWVAAQQFLEKHMLHLSQLEQVANHIQKVAGPYVYTKPTGSQYSDPFTGSGRYLPGANQPQGSQSGTDPFTGGTRYRPNESGKEEGLPTLGGGSGFTSDPITGGSRYIPPGMDSGPKVTFTQDGKKLLQPNKYYPVSALKTFQSAGSEYGEKVWSKISELNSTLQEPIALSASDLLEVFTVSTGLSETPPSSNLTGDHFRLLHRMLNWPVDKVFPALDLLRLALLHPMGGSFFLQEGLGSELLDKLIQFTVSSSPEVKNSQVAFRCIANMFSHQLGVALLMEHKQFIFQSMDVHLTSTNRNIQIAICTILLNYCFCFKASSNSEDVVIVLTQAAKILKSDDQDPEAKYRTLLALGTLAHINRDVVDSIASNEFKDLTRTLISAQHQKLSECAKLLFSNL